MTTAKRTTKSKLGAAQFRDRIVGLVWAEPARLKKHPENWRLHPDAQRQVMRAVLGEVGIAGAAIAFVTDDAAREEMLALKTREKRAAWLASYKGKLTLIDGHLRKDEITQPIPTLVLDVGPDEARKALATHDAVTALATARRGALVALATSAGFKNDTIGLALAAAQQRYTLPLAALPRPQGGPLDDEEEEEPVIPTDALVKKWGTAPGQLWVVPSLTVPGREHRLLCGDCRDPANVERLRDGRRPVLGLHDAPYGINAVSIPSGRTAGSVWGHAPRGAVSNKQRGNKAHKTAFAPIVDDDKPFDPSHILASAPVLVLWGGNCFANMLPASAEWLAWVKLADDAGECHFSSAELAWVSPPKNRKGHVRRISCLRVPGGMEGDATRYHPTQKPVKVQRAPIEWYTEPGDDVEDWYMGAGGVIIACELTGRIGHGIDIAHAYLAATLERLAVRGLKPRLVTQTA